ncbi:MAG TPA: hypothetical protein VFF68_14065 [Anaerolineaceae bacterium]|nr:hypothetical protein [Anaerolineaceae bacterium]
MSQLPDTALILVAVMTNPRDLDIARLLGWYRIPLRFAPKVIDVDYLAFYQTAGFGEDQRWQIAACAPVRGHELTTRGELIRSEADHPRANEEYYKVQLGPLVSLRQPILADRWRRITFLYTTGELLNQAETINDLVVRSEDREILWRSLRERALQKGVYQSQDLPEDLLDAALQAMLGDFDQIAEGSETYLGE